MLTGYVAFYTAAVSLMSVGCWVPAIIIAVIASALAFRQDIRSCFKAPSSANIAADEG